MGGGVMTSMRLRLVFAFSCLDLLLLCSGAVQWWGGGEGGGGGMTSMRLRTVFSFSFVDLLLLCSGAVQLWGGGEMTSMRMRLVFSFSFVDLLRLSIVSVVISGYLFLDFPHVYHAKTSSFCSSPEENFATAPKIEQKHTNSMVFATLSQKRY